MKILCCSLVFLALAANTLPAYQAPRPLQTRVNADAAIILDFTKRVNEYLKIHKKIAAAVHNLKSTDSQEAIVRHERELADGIRAARVGARQGEIFTPEISGVFRRLLVAVTKGPPGKKVQSSLKQEEPAKLELAVNRAYPSDQPLQSTPPTLLANFPVLPKEVEYRIVGPHLILRDVDANLIIDFVLNAITQNK